MRKLRDEIAETKRAAAEERVRFEAEKLQVGAISLYLSESIVLPSHQYSVSGSVQVMLVRVCVCVCVCVMK